MPCSCPRPARTRKRFPRRARRWSGSFSAAPIPAGRNPWTRKRSASPASARSGPRSFSPANRGRRTLPCTPWRPRLSPLIPAPLSSLFHFWTLRTVALWSNALEWKIMGQPSLSELLALVAGNNVRRTDHREFQRAACQSPPRGAVGAVCLRRPDSEIRGLAPKTTGVARHPRGPRTVWSRACDYAAGPAVRMDHLRRRPALVSCRCAAWAHARRYPCGRARPRTRSAGGGQGRPLRTIRRPGAGSQPVRRLRTYLGARPRVPPVAGDPGSGDYLRARRSIAFGLEPVDRMGRTHRRILL